MRIADVNNDGRMDIVVVRGGPSNVYVFLNSGSFSAPFPLAASQTLTLGAWAVDVALFDVDGDTFLDAVMTEGVAGRVVFSKNNAGTFAAPTLLMTIANPSFLAAADIDNDNDLDIAFSAGNGVHVMKYGIQPALSSIAPPRNGNGSVNPNIAATNAPVTVNFSTNITAATFTVPPAQQLFQVHGGMTGSRTRAQGFSVNGSYTGGAATMTFTPSANFQRGELVSVTVTNASSSVTAPNNSVGIRTRPYVFDYRVAAVGGPATFVQNASYMTTNIGIGMTTADINNDNRLDMITADFFTNTIRIRTGNNDGTFSGTGTDLLVNAQPGMVRAADFNNDGLPDIVAPSSGSNNVSVRMNTTGTPGTFGATVNLNAGSVTYYVTVGDYNGDGNMDIAATHESTIRIFLGNGNGTFQAVASYSHGGALGSGSRAETGDLDGDGDMDIAVAHGSSNVIYSMLNDGTGKFTQGYARATGSTNTYTIELGDVNADGRLDAVVITYGTSEVRVFIGAGDGSFGTPTAYSTGAGSTPRTVVLADFDGVNGLDIATANLGTNTIGILLNNGGGTFAAVNSYATTGVQPAGLAAGDMDNDGDIDLLVNYNGSAISTVHLNAPIPTTYYYQSGDAGFPTNWNSLPNGLGTPATAFSSPATDFYVMGSNPVGTVTTATVNTSFTIGANVSLHTTTPSVLAVANGITITNNGFLNVSGNTVQAATLRLVGTGAIAGNPVTYWGTTATLEYSGTIARATSAVEFPGPMPGSVTMNNTGGVTLHANRQINGTFTMQSGTFTVEPRTLQLNGAANFNGGAIGGGTLTDLVITGSGNLNGEINITGGLENLTMNRAGALLKLAVPVDLSATGVLTLTQGYVQSAQTRMLSMQNTTAGAIVGGGTASHIVGPLQRTLPAIGGTFTFPIGGGTATTYLPMSVAYTIFTII